MTWEEQTPEQRARVRQCVHRALQRLGSGQTAAAVRVEARASNGFRDITLDYVVAALVELHESGAVERKDGKTQTVWRIT
jgi:hypothetical protein